MTPRRGVIGSGLMSRANRVTKLNYLLHLGGRLGLGLLKTVDLDLVVFVFENLELLFVVQQIHAFAAINLEHRQPKFDLRVLLTKLEEIVNCVFGYGIDSERFA